MRKWNTYSFDKVEKAKYDILVSLPREDVSSKVEILDKDKKSKFQSQTREKVRKAVKQDHDYACNTPPRKSTTQHKTATPHKTP